MYMVRIIYFVAEIVLQAFIQNYVHHFVKVYLKYFIRNFWEGQKIIYFRFSAGGGGQYRAKLNETA
jgi:hypothetical protein